MAAPSADAEKLEKLKEKYNQLKQANAVLKKGLLDKQEECAQKDAQVKEKETTIRQQLEEIDHLQFQNGRMSKQMGTLNDQVTELQKQKPTTGLSAGIGFFSGKQQQEAVQRAENEVQVLRDELVTKIEENEDLHMQMYECKRLQEEEGEKLGEKLSSATAELELKSTEVTSEQEKVSQLTSENKDMTERIEALDNDLVASRSLTSNTQSKLEEERQESKKETDTLVAQLKRWVPFDEAAHSPWNRWNCSSLHGREAQWRKEAMKQFQSCVIDACKQSCSVLEGWSKTFRIGNDGEPAKRLKMRLKLSETAERLAGMFGETIPNLITTLGQAQMRPSSVWERHFKQSVRSLMLTHRRWVTLQSVLLLHDDSDARSARSAKEEAQAQNFVDCLWRLHRCLGIFFSKLKLFFLVSLLTTQCGSSMHFMQAREALRRGPQSAGLKHSQDRAGGRLSRGGTGPLALGGARAGGSSESPRSPPKAAASNHILGTTGDKAAVEKHLITASTELMERMRAAVKDVSVCWEGIARCLSSWATGQKSSDAGPDDGNGILSLLESLHGLCACMTDRILPSMDSLLADVPSTVTAAVHSGRPSMWGLTCHVATIISSGPASRTASASSCLNRYIAKAGTRLFESPGSIGFAESSQTQVLVRQLATEKSRLSGEVRQQIKRLREVSNEKGILSDDLRVLQDNHALLRSNLQALKEQSGQRRDDDVAGLSQPELLCVERPGSNDLVLTSRQRALLESLSVTSQESNGLRQHGYFVDTLSLTTGEAALAAGPPDMDAYESWEMAVRKVYEQHARNLQAQVRVADDKAKEMYVCVQENMDLLKEQEDAKQKLREEVAAKQSQLTKISEDTDITQKNYDSQLAILTEHICTLSSQLSVKDASVASLHTYKILCGHCGMWNAMGKLLAKDSGGKCNTCKEKVIQGQ